MAILVVELKTDNSVFRRKSRIGTEINKLASVFHAFCPIVNHEFRHNVVKVAVDPPGVTKWIHRDPQTNLTML